MPFTVLRGARTPHLVAGCNALAQMSHDARMHYEHIASDPALEINDHARSVMHALDATAGARAATVRKLEDAIDSTGEDLQRLAREAILSSADLFHAIAIQTRNPNLIGTAAAVDITIDATEFAIQILTADDSVTQQRAVAAFVKGRWTTIQTLVSGPGKTFSQKQFAVAGALTDAMVSLSQKIVDERALRRELAYAKDALEDVETQISGLPVNHAEWQQFMLNQLDAEIFVLELLQSEYASTDCRIDRVSTPGFG